MQRTMHGQETSREARNLEDRCRFGGKGEKGGGIRHVLARSWTYGVRKDLPPLRNNQSISEQTRPVSGWVGQVLSVYLEVQHGRPRPSSPIELQRPVFGVPPLENLRQGRFRA